jgi:hypothetical protein
VARVIERVEAATVRESRVSIDAALAAAHARAPGGRSAPRILAAIKYLPDDQLPVLAEAGIGLVGENRAQQLAVRSERFGSLFEWHFIGQLQSRKVAAIAPRVTLIHSLASRSALAALEKARGSADPRLKLLVEVNVSGEPGKAGVAPDEVGEYVAAAPFPVVGLMTMPPLTGDAEASRPYFASLRELADIHSLAELSMGTSQDWAVAAEEGATIVRIGTSLLEPRPREGPASG